jgi:phosphonate transport system permease protein
MRRSSWAWIFGAALFAAVVLWAARGAEFDFRVLASGAPHFWDFLGRMLPPDSEALGPAWKGLVETVQIAVLGTLLGTLVALPAGFLAAKNLMPRWCYPAARAALTFVRTVPTLVWALMFVAVVGLGAPAGVLATCFYTIGMLGKLFYEGLEAVPRGPVEAVESTGAPPLLVWRYAVMPQVAPQFLGYILYMFEYNVRNASVLGMVGAGGVGFYILTYMHTFQYPKAATVILLTLITVLTLDAASLALRKRIQ